MSGLARKHEISKDTQSIHPCLKCLQMTRQQTPPICDIWRDFSAKIFHELKHELQLEYSIHDPIQASQIVDTAGNCDLTLRSV